MQTFRRNILSLSSGLKWRCSEVQRSRKGQRKGRIGEMGPSPPQFRRWRQYLSPKRLYLPTSVQCLTTQRDIIIRYVACLKVLLPHGVHLPPVPTSHLFLSRPIFYSVTCHFKSYNCPCSVPIAATRLRSLQFFLTTTQSHFIL
jgi:hypothetical protein